MYLEQTLAKQCGRDQERKISEIEKKIEQKCQNNLCTRRLIGKGVVGKRNGEAEQVYIDQLERLTLIKSN
jgi:hypothetical protein